MTIKKFLKYLGWFLLCALTGILPTILGGWYIVDWQWWLIAMLPVASFAIFNIKE